MLWCMYGNWVNSVIQVTVYWFEDWEIEIRVLEISTDIFLLQKSLNPVSIGNCLAEVKCRSVSMITPSVQCQGQDRTSFREFHLYAWEIKTSNKILHENLHKASVFRPKEVI